MADFFVCMKDCTFAGQRWYPGDKMPASYARDGKIPRHFDRPDAWKARLAKEAEEKHQKEVQERIMSQRDTSKTMTQGELNKDLGSGKKVKVDKPLGKAWKDFQDPTKNSPPIAGMPKKREE